MKKNILNKKTKRTIELANLGIGLHAVKNVDDLFKDINKEPDKLALKTAKEIVKGWKIICTKIDNGYYGHCKKLKQVFGDGGTKKACVKDTKEALEYALAFILEIEEDRILGEAANEVMKNSTGLITEKEFFKKWFN